jgi:hypothetical protein
VTTLFSVFAIVGMVLSAIYACFLIGIVCEHFADKSSRYQRALRQILDQLSDRVNLIAELEKK